MGPATEEERVRAVNTALYDAFETGDIDLMEAVWLDDESAGEVVCVHPGWPPVRGRSAVLRSWSVIMANTAYIQFVLTEVDVRVVDDVAVVTCGENVLTGMPDAGGETTSGFTGGRAVATNIFRRTPSGWRLWVHHASPVVAMQEEP